MWCVCAWTFVQAVEIACLGNCVLESRINWLEFAQSLLLILPDWSCQYWTVGWTQSDASSLIFYISRVKDSRINTDWCCFANSFCDWNCRWCRKQSDERCETASTRLEIARFASNVDVRKIDVARDMRDSHWEFLSKVLICLMQQLHSVHGYTKILFERAMVDFEIAKGFKFPNVRFFPMFFFRSLDSFWFLFAVAPSLVWAFRASMTVLAL